MIVEPLLQQVAEGVDVGGGRLDEGEQRLLQRALGQGRQGVLVTASIVIGPGVPRVSSLIIAMVNDRPEM